MIYVINWHCGLGNAYITKRQPNRKPYASSPYDPDVKTWKTRAGAERFLRLKDPGWASMCEIERRS